MKTEKNILIAFILNIAFSILEFIGGILTNSVAIISDSIHDMGDSLSIGVSYFLEKKSKKAPDDRYTYGYTRYSVLGALITTVILLVGSVLVIISAIKRIMMPVEVNYNGMIIFAVFGVVINFLAASFTSNGDSINQKAVNLHMLEDVLGWLVVLIGSIIMRFTDISVIDPIMSILVTLFILINSFKNFTLIVDLFLEKIPKGVSVDEIKEHLLELDNIIEIHHIHIWSIDSYNNYATMHVVVAKYTNQLKETIRKELEDYGISHVTIEIEDKNTKCKELVCKIKNVGNKTNHHHH